MCEDSDSVDEGDDTQEAAVEDSSKIPVDLSLANNVIENRFNILDSILKRKRDSEQNGNDSCSSRREKIYRLTPVDSSGYERCGSYRVKMRCKLAESFIHGVRVLGMQESAPRCQEYCSLLAWTLEDIVYNQFPWSIDSPSDDGKKDQQSNYSLYSEKLRSLRYNLEDKRNPALCTRVLVQRLDLDSLVHLSPQELASKHSQELREQAAENAAKQRVLDASDTEFGLLGLVQQRSSFVMSLSAANEGSVGNETSLDKSDLSKDAKLQHTSTSSQTTSDLDGPSKTSPIVKSNSMEEQEGSAELQGPEKADSFESREANPDSDYDPSDSTRTDVGKHVLAKVGDLLEMNEPEESDDLDRKSVV